MTASGARSLSASSFGTRASVEASKWHETQCLAKVASPTEFIVVLKKGLTSANDDRLTFSDVTFPFDRKALIADQNGPSRLRYEEGSGAEVLGAPKHPYTRRLIASLPVPNPAEQATRREELRMLRAEA